MWFLHGGLIIYSRPLFRFKVFWGCISVYYIHTVVGLQFLSKAGLVDLGFRVSFNLVQADFGLVYGVYFRFDVNVLRCFFVYSELVSGKFRFARICLSLVCAVSFG